VVIGVSLGYIHRGVDKFVDATLFRKRHEDEQALLHFSKEAAYVTKAESLLDQAIGQVARHTDARNAAILLDQRSSYEAVRSFGDGLPLCVDENDGVILALKTWNKPLDPHRYATALQGALALPMVARGRLLGVLFLGERAGGEAYAPDEVEALSAFAHGVGSAIGALSTEGADSIAALRESIASMGDSITESLANAMQALPGSIAAELRDKPSPHRRRPPTTKK
jgi:GAF domain-containing protein